MIENNYARITKAELGEILDKSNFYIDSENPYDMKILAVLKEQTHSCYDCNEADFCCSGKRIYCLTHGYYAEYDGSCRDWRGDEE